MSVAYNIKQLRKRNGLTQEELAERLDVARSTIAQWESGVSHPRYSRIEALAEVFGVTRADIVTDQGGTASQSIGPFADATVPLVALSSLRAGSIPSESAVIRRVEVPASVLIQHPNAWATIVEDDSMDRVLPSGAVVVFDLDLQPSNGQIALVRTDDHQTLLRRWYRGGTTLMLVADSHGSYDDIVLSGPSPIGVVGTVVHWQGA